MKRRWYIILAVWTSAFLLFGTWYSAPDRLIRDGLRSHGVETSAKIVLKKIDSRHYRLINPIVDPVTNVVLENWELKKFCQYPYAVCLDCDGSRHLERGGRRHTQQ